MMGDDCESPIPVPPLGKGCSDLASTSSAPASPSGKRERHKSINSTAQVKYSEAVRKTLQSAVTNSNSILSFFKQKINDRHRKSQIQHLFSLSGCVVKEVVLVGWRRAQGNMSVLRCRCARGQAASKEGCPAVVLELHPQHSGKGIRQTKTRVLLGR